LPQKAQRTQKINTPASSLLLAPLPGCNLCQHLSGGFASLSHRLHASTPSVSKYQSLRAKFWGLGVFEMRGTQTFKVPLLVRMNQQHDAKNPADESRRGFIHLIFALDDAVD
jgi:hypothetical protein